MIIVVHLIAIIISTLIAFILFNNSYIFLAFVLPVIVIGSFFIYILKLLELISKWNGQLPTTYICSDKGSNSSVLSMMLNTK